MAKTEYQIGEEIFVEPRLINVGKKPIMITHGDPLFFVEVYDERGTRVLIPTTIRLDIGITHELRPNDPYFYHRVGYEQAQVTGYKFLLGEVGVYRIVAYAELSIEDCKGSLRIYADHVWIEVVAG